jgi:ketosteroid isomerase-like protein
MVTLTEMRCVTLLFVILFCAATTQAKEYIGEEKAIVDVDEAMVAALNQRDVETWLTYWSEDGSMWPHCAPKVIGKAAISEYIQGFVSIPTFVVTHDLETVVVADSGELGYITYSYQIGNPLLEAGKDLSVFRKDETGSWKIYIDMWSTDKPPCG